MCLASISTTASEREIPLSSANSRSTLARVGPSGGTSGTVSPAVSRLRNPGRNPDNSEAGASSRDDHLVASLGLRVKCVEQFLLRSGAVGEKLDVLDHQQCRTAETGPNSPARSFPARR